MRIGTVALLATSATWLATPGLAWQARPESPADSALRFFDSLPPGVEPALRFVRTQPLHAAVRVRILAALPSSGELTPTPKERTRLGAVQTILVFHERQGVFDIKVIDVPQAFLGLHGRAVLLVSRPALAVLSPVELQAMVAHEVGHDFLWAEFERARRTRDRQARRQLELRCDGIAALTLMALGLDPMKVPAAALKLQRFNERLGVLDVRGYPTLLERQRFVKALARRQ